MIETIRQGLEEDGFKVSISKLCRWFGVPRRTFYYRTVKAPPKLQERLVEPVKAMIEENPSFGYRTVAGLLGMNRNTVQRIFQIKGWQVRKRTVGFRPRIQALPSVAQAPNERWATVSDQPSTRFNASIRQNRCPLDSGGHLFWRSGGKTVDVRSAATCRGWALLRPAHPAAPVAPTGGATAPRSDSWAASAAASAHRSGMPADRAR